MVFLAVSGIMDFSMFLCANIPQNRTVKGFVACAEFEISRKEEF